MADNLYWDGRLMSRWRLESGAQSVQLALGVSRPVGNSTGSKGGFGTSEQPITEVFLR